MMMSNEDIKMSDVFDLPMTVGSSQGITGCIDTELGDNNLWLADFFDEDAINDVCKANDMAEAAAHAINNHDQMALRIKELESALKDCVNDYINFDGEHLTSSIFERAHKLLEQT